MLSKVMAHQVAAQFPQPIFRLKRTVVMEPSVADHESSNAHVADVLKLPEDVLVRILTTSALSVANFLSFNLAPPDTRAWSLFKSHIGYGSGS